MNNNKQERKKKLDLYLKGIQGEVLGASYLESYGLGLAWRDLVEGGKS